MGSSDMNIHLMRNCNDIVHDVIGEQTEVFVLTFVKVAPHGQRSQPCAVLYQVKTAAVKTA